MTERVFRTLISFADTSLSKLQDYIGLFKEASCEVDVFLDSGAFTAKTLGVVINIDEYIQYIHDNASLFTFYANLDVIDDWKTTAENQEIMEQAGLKPLPILQYGAPMKEAARIAEKYPFVCIGGIAGAKDKGKRISYAMGLIVEAQRVNPSMEFHGFGATSYKLLTSFPWTTADSTTWVFAQKSGQLVLFDPWGKKAVTINRKGLRDTGKWKAYRWLARLFDYYAVDFFKFTHTNPYTGNYWAAGLKSNLKTEKYLNTATDGRFQRLYSAGFCGVVAKYKVTKEFVDYLFSDGSSDVRPFSESWKMPDSVKKRYGLL